jgi:hypothetical protein
MNLASQLADQISTEAAGWSTDVESDLSYMANQEGSYVGDPALDRDRAARVWNLLNDAQAERILEVLVSSESPAPESTEASWDYAAEMESQDQEFYDMLDMAETFALSDGGESSAEYGDVEAEYE